MCGGDVRGWRARGTPRVAQSEEGARSPVLAGLSEDAVIIAAELSWACSSECDSNHSAPARSAPIWGRS